MIDSILQSMLRNSWILAVSLGQSHGHVLKELLIGDVDFGSEVSGEEHSHAQDDVVSEDL